jgi:hypothetical protein
MVCFEIIRQIDLEAQDSLPRNRSRKAIDNAQRKDMETPHTLKQRIEQAGRDLFDYAIDRQEVKYLAAHHPKASAVTAGKLEYELQILKIITVGWSIAFCLHDRNGKAALLELFWQAIQQFSLSLSESTGLLVGQTVDYFEILKARLDTYVAALAAHPQAHEPAQVLGSEFATACGRSDDIFAFMAGSKMFLSANKRVTEYLSQVDL